MESLLPESDDLWMMWGDHLAAIDLCQPSRKHACPIADREHSDLAKEANDRVPTTVNQKGTAHRSAFSSDSSDLSVLLDELVTAPSMLALDALPNWKR
jgi:hypothetical protein